MNVKTRRYYRMNPANGSLTSGHSSMEHLRQFIGGHFETAYTDLVELIPTNEVSDIPNGADIIAIVRRVEWTDSDTNPSATEVSS